MCHLGNIARVIEMDDVRERERERKKEREKERKREIKREGQRNFRFDDEVFNLVLLME